MLCTAFADGFKLTYRRGMPPFFYGLPQGGVCAKTGFDIFFHEIGSNFPLCFWNFPSLMKLNPNLILQCNTDYKVIKQFNK